MFEIYSEDISSDLPCGPFIDDSEALEDDFIMLESIARINQDSLVLGASDEGVDWRLMYSRCEDLVKQTKDVRVYVFLAQAALHLKKLAGFAASFQLITTTLTDHWDDTYPKLDDAKDETPWRIMTLNELSGEVFINLLSSMPVVESKLAGNFTLRDIKLAKGDIQLIEGSEEKIQEIGLIGAAFKESSQDALVSALALVNQIQDNIEHLQNQLSASDVSHSRYGWDKLKADLNYLSILYSEYIVHDVVAEENLSVNDENNSDSKDMAVITKNSGIENRSDVLEALSKITEYYSQYEPSSPVPILVERTKKLVTMDFMSIMKELSPDGVKQVELIAGVELDS